jgi:hypothetical protein
MAAGIARYAYFLLWLGSLIFLLGRAGFGTTSQPWHTAVYFLMGVSLGSCGGYFFAGPLGLILGVASGAVLGPAIWVARHFYLRWHDEKTGR